MADIDLLDLITVEAARREELTADRADLFLTIQGTSLVTGNQALQKAREVAQFVGELGQRGLPPENIYLEGVDVSLNGGLVKTSQASYHLRIHCPQLEQVGDVLGVVAAQKNITLRHLRWGYGDDRELRDALLDDCARRAHAKAKKIAAALGVKLVGVHRFAETFVDREAGPAPAPRGADMDFGMVRARRMASPVDLGTDVSHAKTV
ncbi:MAG: SIMPL domain-containing protein, partial [Armatimonadota bacterium]|nr:SIMPL domain-containing protein [Armatimonadota bacterium]